MDIPSRIDVIVLINNVDVLFSCQLPTCFVVGTFEEWTHSSHYLNVWVFLLDSFVEIDETLFKHIANKVFISDTYHFEIEWFRMSCFKA